MKSRTLLCAVTAASLGFSSLGFAQASGYDAHLDTGRPGELHAQYQGRGHDRNDHRYERGRDHRDDGDRHDYYGPHGTHYYYGARGPEWRRGGHIPPQYRSRQYVVTDWRAHHLYAPPRGHEWVQVGSDYVLIAIATGVITSLLLAQ
ncbi:MAG: RcnB family protein [Ramlibacter sp.]|nr:RcnB family protein [Ramlibacter sp.]